MGPHPPAAIGVERTTLSPQGIDGRAPDQRAQTDSVDHRSVVERAKLRL